MKEFAGDPKWFRVDSLLVLVGVKLDSSCQKPLITQDSFLAFKSKFGIDFTLELDHFQDKSQITDIVITFYHFMYSRKKQP